jgi:hypothetical protein
LTAEMPLFSKNIPVNRRSPPASKRPEAHPAFPTHRKSALRLRRYRRHWRSPPIDPLRRL